MILSGDFETYYDKEYSLSKMSEVEYILDPRFEAIMLSLKRDNGPSNYYVGRDEIARVLADMDWSRVAWLSHNTRFDGAILAWHFGYVPKMYLCSLSMARATTHWVLGKSSLAAVSTYLDLPPKGDEVVRAIGKRLADFTPDELRAYGRYCNRDNDNAYSIFQKMRRCFSNTELQIIDLVLRMFILPQVLLDPDVLTDYLTEVRREKAEALAQVAHIDKSVFASNAKFAALLDEYGVDVPQKYSPLTGQYIPALAKNDWAFKELCADASQPAIVQVLLATRLSVKSTIDETRTENLLRLSQTRFPLQGVGWGAVPLKYAGARTHRLSGDGGINWQNLRRGSTIRKGVKAPPGYRIVHRDASQIEARMTAWLAWCMTLLDAFRQGRDVYCEFASSVYQRPVTRADVTGRFVGKTAILGLGYGCGAPRFRHMLYIGNGGVSHRIELDEAEQVVRTYRRDYWEIPDLWHACGLLLEQMVQMTTPTSKGMARVARSLGSHNSILAHLPVTAGFDALWLPSGLCISYPKLRHFINAQTGETGICYNDPYGSPRRIYGAKVVENISQALARIIVTDIAVRTHAITGYDPWLSTHDSLDYCVPASEAEDMDAELEREFAIVPEWADGLPLASEGGWGVTLHDAERRVNA